MPINFPTLKQIIERSRNDLRDTIPTLDPSKPKSFIRAIIDSNAGRAFDMSILLKQVLRQFFYQTAVDPYLALIGEYNNLQSQPAQPSIGFGVFTGTAGTTIPIDTLYNSVAGNQYKTLSAEVLQTISQSLLTAVADAQKIVTCTTTLPHSLATGVLADFTGLTNSANTTDAAITSLGLNSFSFYSPTVTIVGSVLGTGAYMIIGAKIGIESVEPGADKDLSSGSVLTIVSPISGADTEGYADFSGIQGGTDDEDIESFRDRIGERRANPVANFNVAAIVNQAKLIPAVTRVFVAEITPYPGAVTIYFFVSVDGSQSGIPNPSQISDVLDSILLIKPGTTDPDDVIVEAPNVVPIAHVINSLVPNTSTLQSAVSGNLQAWYEDNADLGLDITLDMIKNIIQNSQDLTTGEFPTSFTLVTPAATTTVNATEIAQYSSTSFT